MFSGHIQRHLMAISSNGTYQMFSFTLHVAFHSTSIIQLPRHAISAYSSLQQLVYRDETRTVCTEHNYIFVTCGYLSCIDSGR